MKRKVKIHTLEDHSVAAKIDLDRSHSVGKEDDHTQQPVAADRQADLDMDTGTAVRLAAVVVRMEPHLAAAVEGGSSKLWMRPLVRLEAVGRLNLKCVR
jgi:hypothetical protein